MQRHRLLVRNCSRIAATITATLAIIVKFKFYRIVNGSCFERPAIAQRPADAPPCVTGTTFRRIVKGRDPRRRRWRTLGVPVDVYKADRRPFTSHSVNTHVRRFEPAQRTTTVIYLFIYHGFQSEYTSRFNIFTHY